MSGSSNAVAGKEGNFRITSKYGLHHQPYEPRGSKNILFRIPRGLRYIDLVAVAFPI